MEYEIEEEFNSFKNDVNDSAFIFGSYLDESDYEDEYSHNVIDEATEILVGKIRKYLHEKQPNKFVVSTGWCIHVMTPDRARQSRISERTIEEYLVK